MAQQELDRSEIIARVFDEKSNNNKRVKELLKNAAILISIAAILLTITLYSYNMGYCKIYNIPVESKNLDLKSYLPLIITITTLSVYIISYYVSFIEDKVKGKISISIDRILLCFIIITYPKFWGRIQTLIDSKTIEIISYILIFTLPILIELVIYFIKVRKYGIKLDKERPFKFFQSIHKTNEEKCSKQDVERDKKFENSINGTLMYEYYVRYGLSLIIIIILSSPFVGKFIAKSTTQYQTCTLNNQCYAVVVDNKDEVVLQKATEKDDALTLDTSSYVFKDKDGMEFEYKYYDKVHIK